MLGCRVPVPVKNATSFPGVSSNQFEIWQRLVDNMTSTSTVTSGRNQPGGYGARTSATSSTPSFTLALDAAYDDIGERMCMYACMQHIVSGDPSSSSPVQGRLPQRLRPRLYHTHTQRLCPPMCVLCGAYGCHSTLADVAPVALCKNTIPVLTPNTAPPTAPPTLHNTFSGLQVASESGPCQTAQPTGQSART